MNNVYDEKLIEIAEVIRKAQTEGWGNFEIGESINTIPEILGINGDEHLLQSLSTLELVQELTETEEAVLLSAFSYACYSISDLGIDVNEAIWRKYYINLYTHAIPQSIALNEINRHAVLGGEYQEGIFDELSSLSRKDSLTLRLRREAYRNAERFVKESSFPIGESNVGVIQLVFRDWLLRLGKEFTTKELHALLLGEVREFIDSVDKWDRVYEACDIIIYILHIYSVYGINIAERIPKE